MRWLRCSTSGIDMVDMSNHSKGFSQKPGTFTVLGPGEHFVPPPPPPKMILYRAKDHGGTTLGIILARGRDQADAYFIGRGQHPHTMDEIDVDQVDQPLMILFKTHKMKTWQMREILERRSAPDEVTTEDKS